MSSTEEKLVGIAKMLGIRSKDGTDVSTMLDRLSFTLEGILKRANASSLINETALSDCTIRVTIGAIETLGAPERETWGEEQCLKVGAGHSIDVDPTSTADTSEPLGRRAHIEGVDGATVDKAQPESGPSEGVRLIRAHAAILAVHSKYFRALLTGGWKEDSQKTVDVRVSSIQEFEDFELLLKLAYGLSYVMLDSQPVEKDVLLRLLPLADSFEFVGFLDACINSLREELTAEEAHLCLEAIPASLQADLRLKNLLQDASDVVAEDIGHLHQLFEASPVCRCKEDEDPGSALLLKAAAKAIPPFFLQHLLASPKLRVESENDTFAMAMACLDYHLDKGSLSEAEAEAYCTKILLLLRFHHMSLHFLSCVVALHPRVIASGQLPEIMVSSLAYRVNMYYVFKHHAHEPSGPVNRGDADEHQLTCSFTLAECMAVQEGEALSRCAGLAGGYPISVTIGRGSGSNGSHDTIAVHTVIHMPACSRPGGQALGWLRAKVRCDYPGVTGPVWEGLVDPLCYICHQGLFKGSSWSQVIREGSSVFREGSLCFSIHIWYPVDVQNNG